MAVVAVLDANVLHQMPLCDVLLELHIARFFRAVWSPKILDETIESLRRRGFPERLLARRRAWMVDRFGECLNRGGARFLGAVPGEVPHGDRHVVACALAARAAVIVTHNLGDFPADALAALGVTPQSPHDFLLSLWRRDPNSVLTILTERAEDLVDTSLVELLDNLGKHAPGFADVVRNAAPDTG